jgi:hypothetical protein
MDYAYLQRRRCIVVSHNQSDDLSFMGDARNVLYLIEKDTNVEIWNNANQRLHTAPHLGKTNQDALKNLLKTSYTTVVETLPPVFEANEVHLWEVIGKLTDITHQMSISHRII